ncbi:MAG TPA: M20/M25/M40 family metallo-hydrolase [Candidatus Saccharimonadales bacterium]
MEDLLAKLVSFHTTEDDPQAMHQALDYIADYVGKRGMFVERYNSNGHESLVATIRPGQKTPTVMLAAHLDVVPAPDELFIMREADGKLYGRGTLDMKFAIAAYLQLVDDLQDRLEDYDFAIMITCDEETGGINGTAKLLEEGYLPKVAILPDGGDNWQIQTLSKGFVYGKIRAYGKAAHGSRTWQGDNAILKLIDILAEVRQLFEQPARMEVSTLNIGQFHGGMATNQVAADAYATVDARFINNHEKAKALQAIRDVCAKYDAEFDLFLDGAEHRTDLTSTYAEPLARHIRAITGTEVTGWSTPASSDARYFADHDIPCLSVYPIGGGHHGPEEWLDRQAFHQYKEVLQAYLDEIAHTTATTSVNIAERVDVR